ncbi:hypothetical protein ABPG72_004315 [Tetrahymena utriculariae]
MAVRTQQHNRIFANNSQLILGTQISLIQENNGLSNSTMFQNDPQNMLSPIKHPQSIKQIRSSSQNIQKDIQSPEQLPKIKRPRKTENTINLFQEAKQQQIQNNLLDSNQANPQQKINQSSTKKSMSDMLQDWLVNSNSNLTYNDIIKGQTQTDNTQSVPINNLNQVNISSLTPNGLQNSSGIPQNDNGRLNTQNYQISSTPIKNFRKSDNIFTSPVQRAAIIDSNQKNTLEAIEKPIIQNKTPLSGNTFIKEQIDLQTSKNQRQSEKIKSGLQDNQENGQESQNILSQDLPILPLNSQGKQIVSVRNSAQRWFSNNNNNNNNQQGININNQVPTLSTKNKLTSSMINQSQPQLMTIKTEINQTNILNSILTHNNQQKKLQDLGSSVPGKTSNNNGESASEIVSYLKINQNGHQIPIIKQNPTTQIAYNTSIGTKPHITLRRDKIRNSSLIPIDTSSQFQQADNIRDFLGIEKPLEEKQTIVKINGVIQNNQNPTQVGRFKIRKISHSTDIQVNQPTQQAAANNIVSTNQNNLNQQQENNQNQESLSHLPVSPTLSPYLKGKRNVSPTMNSSTVFPNSIPSLNLISQDYDINSSNSDNNNILNLNNVEQNKKITQKQFKLDSDHEINSNKLEFLKLQQAWNFDSQNENNIQYQQPQQEQIQQLLPQYQNKQQQQQQQQQLQQQNMMQFIVQQQPNNQIYNGDYYGHFQYVRGSTIKSKSILKQKSPDPNNPQSCAQMGDEGRNQPSDQNEKCKNLQVPDTNQAQNITSFQKIRGQRKYNSMSNFQEINQNIQRKKCVNFKETLRVINLHRGTESIERLKKPLTGSLII